MCPADGRCRWVAPGMAAIRSCAWEAGVSTSAPPLTTTVLAVMDAIVWYWSKRLRRGKKPAAVVNGVEEMAAATAARAFRSALASPGYLVMASHIGRMRALIAFAAAPRGMW